MVYTTLAEGISTWYARKVFYNLSGGETLDIVLERGPTKDSHMHDWIDFSERLKELGKKGFNLTHATNAYVVLQK